MLYNHEATTNHTSKDNARTLINYTTTTTTNNNDIYIYISLSLYIYIYIYTYIHTYIHKYKDVRSPPEVPLHDVQVERPALDVRHVPDPEYIHE